MSIESSDSFPKKAAAALGGGRMSEAEKREYLENHQERLHHNADFVSVETYTDLFKKIDLNNKIVVNIGAGYSVSPLHYGAMNPVTRAISKIGVPMTFIPVDYNHDRTKSWLLLDTSDSKKNDLIQLEPVTGDATHLPFGDDSLDVYISTNLINEPREDELESTFVRRMIQEAYRVLRPGGSIVLSSFGYVWHKNADGGVVYNNNIDVEEMVPSEMVKKILVDTGFDTVEEIPLDRGDIKAAIARRLTRFPDAVDAGIQDACAFVARKSDISGV